MYKIWHSEPFMLSMPLLNIKYLKGSWQICLFQALDFTNYVTQDRLLVFHLFCRNRGDRQGGQGDVVYPIGYSEKPVPDTSIQETDKNLVEKVSVTFVFKI